MVVIFNLQNSHLLTFSLPTEGLSGKRQKSVSGKSSSYRFSFSDERNANTKATEYVISVFLLIYWFSSFSRKVWTSLSANDTDFLVF